MWIWCSIWKTIGIHSQPSRYWIGPVNDQSYPTIANFREQDRGDESVRLNYINRFIAQLTTTCEPIFKLLKKDVAFKWTDEGEEAFKKIKGYLLNPHVLVPPEPGRLLILYLTVLDISFGCVGSAWHHWWLLLTWHYTKVGRAGRNSFYPIWGSGSIFSRS